VVIAEVIPVVSSLVVVRTTDPLSFVIADVKNSDSTTGGVST
jgi:hypothetical protein